MGAGVPYHHQRPLGPGGPGKFLPHLAENQLITLVNVPSPGLLHRIHKVHQCGDVIGEVHPFGDVGRDCVAVVAMREDGNAETWDVGEKAMYDVGELTADVLYASGHGGGRVKGEDDLQGAPGRHGYQMDGGATWCIHFEAKGKKWGVSG